MKMQNTANAFLYSFKLDDNELIVTSTGGS